MPPGGGSGGVDFALQQALMRLAQVEAELARLSAVIKVQPDGSVEINSNNKLTLKAGSSIELKAASCTASVAQFTINAGITQTTGVFKCDVMQANTVIAATYTPGAGNVW
jgi:hypothetical protein